MSLVYFIHKKSILLKNLVLFHCGPICYQSLQQEDFSVGWPLILHSTVQLWALRVSCASTRSFFSPSLLRAGGTTTRVLKTSVRTWRNDEPPGTGFSYMFSIVLPGHPGFPEGFPSLSAGVWLPSTSLLFFRGSDSVTGAVLVGTLCVL